MTAGEAVGACLGAGICILLAATWGYDAWRALRGIQRWQRTARQAAHDVADTRRARDLATCIAICDATQHDIPHQTHRTEEDQ